MQYTPNLPDDTVNVSQEKPLSIALKLTLSLALLAVLGYFLMRAAIDIAVDFITPQQEQKLASMLSMDMGIAESNSTYLKRVTQKLAACAELPYDIHIAVMEDEELNAFAVPGGMIYVTRGILKKMESENELAFIIGHELGHFKHKDHLRALGGRIVLGAASLMLGSDYGMAMSMTLEIGSAKYSQSAELAADAFGLEVMNCTYGSVTDATKMFEKMDEGDAWRYFVATHPAFEERIKQMRKLIQTRGYDTTQRRIPLGKL
jgi:Zn-dependent protease with chaperone function